MVYSGIIDNNKNALYASNIHFKTTYCNFDIIKLLIFSINKDFRFATFWAPIKGQKLDLAVMNSI